MGNDLHCLRPQNGASASLEPNCFKVRNVNESGHVVNKGYLEVTPTDLILHVANAEPVKWPLRCLRRYGHDANLFSFESGRRCATGPGIYAFKSKYAIQIFRLVQENAQHPDESTSPTTPNNPSSLATTASRHRSLSNDTALPPSQTISRASSNASGVNGSAPAVAANGSLSRHPSVGSNVSSLPPTSPTPLYFNGNSSIGNGSLRTSPISPTIQYVNSCAFGEIPESPLKATPEVSLANGTIPEEVSGHDVSSDSYGDPALNYARLKLPVDEDKSSSGGVWKNCNDERIDGAEQNLEEHGARVEEKEEPRIGKKEEEDTEGMKGNDESGIGAELEHSDGNGIDDKTSSSGCDSGVVEEETESKNKQRTNSKEDKKKDSSLVSILNLKDDESTKSRASDTVVTKTADVSHVMVRNEERDKSEKRLKFKKNGKREVSDIERTALLQDVVNGNIRPEKFKDRNGDAESKLNILVNYANLTEQQIQDVLQKLEANRNDNISPCTVCSTSSSNASQRVSPLSYYANLDTAGELPPNWQPNGFQFYSELRTPRSTSSKGSTGSEFTFEVNRGSCSPVDHNYANLDTLPEMPSLRHSLSSGGASNGAGNWMILQPPPKGKVNYIQLDFDENDQPIIHNVKALRRSMSSSASSTPPKTPVSPQMETVPIIPGAKSDIYARIDIEKTVALANSHRHVEGDTDISTRKTRHDVWTDNKTR